MLKRSSLAGFAGAAFILAAGAHPANAQCGVGCDGPTNWNGFWLGAGVGGSFDMIDHKYVNRNALGAVIDYGTESERGADGFIGTVGAGFDWQIRDRWVIGAFADFDFGNVEHTTVNTWTTGYGSWQIEQNNAWTVGARVGLVTTNTSMIYGLIGYSQTSLDVNVHAEDTAYVNPFDYSDDLTLHGLVLGAGLEHDLGHGFSLKGEYRFTDYGKERFLDGTVSDLEGNFETDDFDVNSHSVRMSLVYKFARERAVEEVSYKDVPPAPSYK